MATYYSILAWEIPQTEEPSGFLGGHKELDMIEHLYIIYVHGVPLYYWCMELRNKKY